MANKNILVIDDDLSILYGMEQVLADWCCNTLSADSEESAIALLHKSEQQIDLIIADYRLRNNKNGVDACFNICLLYTSPSPRDLSTSRMPSSA